MAHRTTSRPSSRSTVRSAQSASSTATDSHRRLAPRMRPRGTTRCGGEREPGAPPGSGRSRPATPRIRTRLAAPAQARAKTQLSGLGPDPLSIWLWKLCTTRCGNCGKLGACLPQAHPSGSQAARPGDSMTLGARDVPHLNDATLKSSERAPILHRARHLVASPLPIASASAPPRATAVVESREPGRCASVARFVNLGTLSSKRSHLARHPRVPGVVARGQACQASAAKQSRVSGVAAAIAEDSFS